MDAERLKAKLQDAVEPPDWFTFDAVFMPRRFWSIYRMNILCFRDPFDAIKQLDQDVNKALEWARS